MLKKQKIAVVAVIAVFILVLTVGFFAFSGTNEIIIAEFSGKKVLLGDYDCFIEFNRRIEIREKRDYILKSLKLSHYLAKKEVRITEEDINKAYAELAKEYFGEKENFTDYYIPIAKSAKIDYNSLKESLRYYAGAVAATNAFKNYAKAQFEAQDKTADDYNPELDGFTFALEKEAVKEQAAIVTSFAESKNEFGVSNYEKHYDCFVAFAAAASKFETVQSIALYKGIDELYGKEADITELEAYLETIFGGIRRIDGYEGILTDMNATEFEFFAQARKFYRNVYVYEQLTKGYFSEKYHLKKTAGTLPEGVETLEDYAAYILIDTALKCKVVTTDFEWNNQK